jgi:hypothetical protein
MLENGAGKVAATREAALVYLWCLPAASGQTTVMTPGGVLFMAGCHTDGTPGCKEHMRWRVRGLSVVQKRCK